MTRVEDLFLDVLGRKHQRDEAWTGASANETIRLAIPSFQGQILKLKIEDEKIFRPDDSPGRHREVHLDGVVEASRTLRQRWSNKQPGSGSCANGYEFASRNALT